MSSEGALREIHLALSKQLHGLPQFEYAQSDGIFLNGEHALDSALVIVICDLNPGIRLVIPPIAWLY